MGRDLRAIDPEAVYHVTSRGSNKGPIVFDAVDEIGFRSELARVATNHRWRVYAWCLMPNHHHVVLRTPEGGFSEGFQQLNGNHSRRTNRRHGRTDHLFRNRPQAREVASTAHLISAVLYVVRNPVAAGLVPTAEAWRSSSYRATVGLERAPAWLAVDEVLELFGRTRTIGRSAFADLARGGHALVSDTRVLRS